MLARLRWMNTRLLAVRFVSSFPSSGISQSACFPPRWPSANEVGLRLCLAPISNVASATANRLSRSTAMKYPSIGSRHPVYWEPRVNAFISGDCGPGLMFRSVIGCGTILVRKRAELWPEGLEQTTVGLARPYPHDRSSLKLRVSRVQDATIRLMSCDSCTFLVILVSSHPHSFQLSHLSFFPYPSNIH